EFGHNHVAELRVWVDLAFLSSVPARHALLPLVSVPVTVRKTRNDPLLGSLGSIFRAPLLAVGHPLRVEHAADDVIAYPRKVLDAATADHHHRMLLQIVALARDVADHLEAVGETYLGDLAQRRVRLLRRRCIDARADAALLWARLHVARLLAVDLLRPRLANQLLYRRHAPLPPFLQRTANPCTKTCRPRPTPPPAPIPDH